MTAMDAQTDLRNRQTFKRFNFYMLWLWRLGFRRWINCWPRPGGRVMVITHTGRRSGLRRRTPVNYALIGDDLYCVAGFGQVSDWFRNIQANSQVELWLPDSWWAGTAQDISSDPNRLYLVRQVLLSTGIVASLYGIDPRKMSEAALDQSTADYRLVRFRRTRRLTGRGGPGDLAWVWIPVSLAALLLYLASRRLR